MGLKVFQEKKKNGRPNNNSGEVLKRLVYPDPTIVYPSSKTIGKQRRRVANSHKNARCYLDICRHIFR